ncbi:hypothetical protein HYR69_02170 [Candidatus Sumerlaeota bacterium]|nr:hypothetical protein [Candidatus Sumerlaeota bacterium]
MADNPKSHVKIDYIKGSQFRVIHADGAVGGLSPRLDIHMTFFSERWPIPQQVAHQVGPDGRIGEEIREDRIQRDGLVRELEADVVLNESTARALVNWIEERLQELQKIREEKK